MPSIDALSRFEEKYTDDDLVAVLRDFGEQLGVVPTTGDYSRESGAGAPSLKTLLRRLGPWPEALKKAGFETPRGYDDGLFIEAIVQYMLDNGGRYPGRHDFGPANNLPSLSTLRNRFASPGNAAGLARDLYDALDPAPSIEKQGEIIPDADGRWFGDFARTMAAGGINKASLDRSARLRFYALDMPDGEPMDVRQSMGTKALHQGLLMTRTGTSDGDMHTFRANGTTVYLSDDTLRVL